MARILVVDDSVFLRHRYVTLLHEMGHEVIEATSGKQAVQAYRLQEPDAVLIDAILPGMDGIETLEAIMALDMGARVAIVTSVARQDVVVEAVHAGARDFVVKPFEPARLKAAVQKLVTA